MGRKGILMAFTQEQLDAIDTAIAEMVTSGAPQRIRMGEKEITYRNMADLLAARALVAGGITSTRKVPRFQIADFSC